MLKQTEEFCLACMEGRVADLQKYLAADASLVAVSGSVHPKHRDYMKSEGADAGWTPLHLAAHYGQVEAVRVLLAAHADVNAKADNAIGNTPLMAAVAGGKAAIVALLLEHGADATLKDKSGLDAARLARLEKKPDIEALLKTPC